MYIKIRFFVNCEKFGDKYGIIIVSTAMDAETQQMKNQIQRYYIKQKNLELIPIKSIPNSILQEVIL